MAKDYSGAVKFSLFILSSHVLLLLLFFVAALQEGLSGGTAAVVSSVILQPLDVMRTKLQLKRTDDRFASVQTTFRTIAKTEGFRGFWSGTGPTILRVFPGGALFYLSLAKFGSLVRPNSSTFAPVPTTAH